VFLVFIITFIIQRDGTRLLLGKAERVGVVQSGQENTLGRPYCGLPVHERGLQERRRGTFSQGHVVTGQGVVALN